MSERTSPSVTTRSIDIGERSLNPSPSQATPSLEIASGAIPAGTRIVVDLLPQQLALLDEWIANRADPKPTRAQAMILHFEWSIARCSSLIAGNERSTVANEITGKD